MNVNKNLLAKAGLISLAALFAGCSSDKDSSSSSQNDTGSVEFSLEIEYDGKIEFTGDVEWPVNIYNQSSGETLSVGYDGSSYSVTKLPAGTLTNSDDTIIVTDSFWVVSISNGDSQIVVNSPSEDGLVIVGDSFGRYGVEIRNVTLDLSQGVDVGYVTTDNAIFRIGPDVNGNVSVVDIGNNQEDINSENIINFQGNDFDIVVKLDEVSFNLSYNSEENAAIINPDTEHEVILDVTEASQEDIDLVTGVDSYIPVQAVEEEINLCGADINAIYLVSENDGSYTFSTNTDHGFAEITPEASPCIHNNNVASFGGELKSSSALLSADGEKIVATHEFVGTKQKFQDGSSFPVSLVTTPNGNLYSYNIQNSWMAVAFTGEDAGGVHGPCVLVTDPFNNPAKPNPASVLSEMPLSEMPADHALILTKGLVSGVTPENVAVVTDKLKNPSCAVYQVAPVSLSNGPQ